MGYFIKACRQLPRVWRIPLVVAALLLTGCAPADSSIEAFRANKIDCPPTDLKVPCEYGPDGLLYRY